MLKPRFVADNRATLERFAAHTRGCAAVVGFVDSDRDIYNAAAVCVNGAIVGTYRKRLLPNYAVFDEARTFTPGTDNDPLELYEIAGVKVGISICEDIWSPFGPLATQAAGGAEVSVNINGSPYHWEKDAGSRAHGRHTRPGRPHRDRLREPGRRAGRARVRRRLVRGRRRRSAARPLAPVRRGSRRSSTCRCRPCTATACSTRAASAPTPRCPLIHISSESRRPGTGAPIESPVAEPLDSDEELYQALVLGTRDYCRKNRFTDVVIGLSGGIDSTIVAVIAADALGPEHVHGVSMPSRYSSDHSKSDAERLAENLGIDYRTISIEPAFQAYIDMLAPSFEGRTPGPHVREHPVALPRPGADGAVERVRLDGAHHRQQERDGGRLLHDLRRLGRRLRGDQGRAQDAASTTSVAG